MAAHVAAAPRHAQQNGSASSSHAADQANWTATEETVSLKTRKLSAGSQKLPQRTKKKRQEESLLRSLCTLICDHQIGLSVNLILLLFLTHIFFPRARRRTAKFFSLSYHNPENGQYGCGIDDLYYVLFWTVLFAGLRVVVMEYIMDPLARLRGIRSKKGLIRFKEQAWLVLYCTGSWSLGMYLTYHSEFWLNLRGLWTGWPFREISGLHKWYYLVQWGFYLQQILVVNIEEKRKDYWEMFTHHIFTCALIFCSYGYYHTRVGTVILCIMDLVDIVLPAAKLLKYMGHSTLCDIAFGAFVVVWAVTRQILYPMVIWSVYSHAPTSMAPGCYLPNGSMVPMSDTSQFTALGGNDIWGNILKGYTDHTGTICWNPTIRYSFLVLLLALQAIICLWFVMIVKVVYKVLSGQGADDVRSDDEGEDSDIEAELEKPIDAHQLNSIKSSHDLAPLEQEVGVESLVFTCRNSPGVRSYKRSSTRSSGSRGSGIVSIPGHGDRKELLGRIGCDKPS